MALRYLERAAEGEPAGLLVLHHGRGTDERDLLGLADELDPERRLTVVSPRGPLVLAGLPGYHWYRVPRFGYPDPQSFFAARAELAALHDSLWERDGLEPARTVLGGFSMGAVMSYAMGLGGDRPAVAGILGFSGFVPTVEGWEASFGDRAETRVLIAHGSLDQVLDVELGRRARQLLEDGGLAVEYHESPVPHTIDPAALAAARDWLAETL